MKTPEWNQIVGQIANETALKDIQNIDLENSIELQNLNKEMMDEFSSLLNCKVSQYINNFIKKNYIHEVQEGFENMMN